MLASTAPLSPTRRFDDIVGGPAALPFYRRQQLSKTSEGLQEIARELDTLHAHIIAQPRPCCARAWSRMASPWPACWTCRRRHAGRRSA
jgi:hypothetical protein